ncbi:capsular polysaccharide biosynthesis protein [Campylobacter upsaliensis]|nr:capsular polysaccharide biosynthesis protein [Campylobacter upsaliensis]EAJ3605463.1 capsular polysaccharide biosynthesis protein [Campylobacter upsaliensis]EAJ8020949.1 capsular polysaccharide biosynthesis protein [Campylobacter upsaliensis]EAK3352530.1 capsular polysaccharide biosynthesis protein [Campylobacter upsaliensis]EDP6854302.1 capsular polysaccharide biosynthesis protein [Campylobacter upsaliensis]
MWVFSNHRLFFLGFTLWKRSFVKAFFKAKSMHFLNSLKELEKFRLNDDDVFLIWGKRLEEEDLKTQIAKQNTNLKPKICFVEDGFIRSVSLGSDLTRPFSLVVDSKGLYIDASKPSDLEEILQNHNFDEELLKRAKSLIDKLKLYKISKYNTLKHDNLHFKAKTGQKIILIPAQVEDDASMLLGGGGLDTLQFIQKVREENPDAHLVFKPHPDVLSGNRKGLKDEKIILQICDEMLRHSSIHSAIEASDEVHTITSTAGFDALLRRKKVVVYGTPFYAGWGLSEDRVEIKRRSRKLSLEELVAGVLILYPLYLHPKTKNLCEVETSLDIITQMQRAYFSKFYIKWGVDSRNYALRKLRRTWETMRGFKK